MLSQPGLGWLKESTDVDKHLSSSSLFGDRSAIGHLREGERDELSF
jgi:hypothetical protein